MRKMMAFLVALTLSSALEALGQDRDIKELADNLAAQATAGSRRVIGVVGFTKDGMCPAFGDFLANRLSILLVAAGKQQFQVVTRNRLSELLREVQLKNARGFDEKTFAELGKLAGADTIVSGDITVFGSKLSVDAQLLDVATGRIVGGQFVEIAKTADLDAMLSARQCPGGGAVQQSKALAAPASGQDTVKAAGADPAKGSNVLIHRRPGAAFAGKLSATDVNIGDATYIDITLTVSHCEMRPSTLRCVQTIPIDKGEAVEIVATKWYLSNQVWDSTGELRKPVNAFFVGSTDRLLPVVNLGKGESAIFVQDFEPVEATVRTVKLANTDLKREVRNIPVY